MKRELRLLGRYAVSFYSPSTRVRLAEEICGERPRFLPGGMLRQIRAKDGPGGMLLADGILFGWCLAAALLIDLLLAPYRAPRGALGILCCAAAFCLCEDHGYRAALKLLFLFFTAIEGDCWTLTVLCMILFEHLALDAGREPR